MIGLVDGNNFYVSCERVFDPSLEGKPVAVMSNNDGCCISRSYEFKALGIPMGTPFFQLKPLIPKHGLILKSSNYELYGDLSRRVIATLSTFTPDVEQYSIDEAFIHVTLPSGSDYFEFGRKVRQTVLQWVGAPPYVKVEVTPFESGDGFLIPISSDAYKAASRAIAEVYGIEPVPSRGGGSIPILAEFQKVLELDPLLMGFGLERDTIHSPNESYLLRQFFGGMQSIALFYKYY